MKKSEMVSILKEVLQQSELAAWANCEASGFIDSLINRDADKIMQTIEKAGMLPPLRLLEYTDTFWDEAIVAEMEGVALKVSEWEKEEIDESQKDNDGN
jgi:hypothetical protein